VPERFLGEGSSSPPSPASDPLKRGSVQEATPNLAERKLQALVQDRVAQQEKALGFEFEREDVLEVEKILRNKYCGKGGLYGALEGGTCAENPGEAVFCSSDPRFSSTSGCANYNTANALSRLQK